MRLTDFVHTVGAQWQRRYGTAVGKIALSGGFTCPNRDGTLGRGGCTFCSVSSFSDLPEGDIASQIAAGSGNAPDPGAGSGRFRRFFAYFQAYTSTYGEIGRLRELYRQASSSAQIVGLSVGTRPDCLGSACVDLLRSLRAEGLDILVELGLQTSCDKTLTAVNRGHGADAFLRAAEMVKRADLELCTHLIVGLPGEELEVNVRSLRTALEAGSDALKMHPLLIARGAVMAAQYRRGEIALLSLEEYVRRAGELIALTPSRVVYHRISSSARGDQLLAPDYCRGRFTVIDAVTSYLSRYGVQGSAAGDPYLPGEPGAECSVPDRSSGASEA